MTARAAQVWWEFAQGRYRLCFSGRVAGTTSRGTHLYATRSEVEAALEAALGLAAGAYPLAPAAALPAPSQRRGALTGPTVPSGPGLPGPAGTGVLAAPTQAPAGAVPRAAQAAMAGHQSTGGANEWTRVAARTTTRD